MVWFGRNVFFFNIVVWNFRGNKWFLLENFGIKKVNIYFKDKKKVFGFVIK